MPPASGGGFLLLLLVALAASGSCARNALDTAESGGLSQEKRESAFHGYSEKGKPLSACRDLNGNCPDWAEKGECKTNPGYMMNECPLSCGECSAPELRAEDFYGESLVMGTPHGDLRVEMQWANAPRTCALVLDLAHNQCSGGHCQFYRVELAPPEGSSGPPYGLLQGNLPGLLKPLPHEGSKPVEYGYIASIQGTDFYIAAMDHSDWGSAHTVWGKVLNMEVVEHILAVTPFHENKHPVGTIMRMANKTIPFTLNFEREHEL